jgi:DNA polymerase III subunit delta
MNPQYTELLKQLTAGHWRPIYLLHGDEPFFIDKIADFIEQNALPAESQSFNQSLFFGKDLSVGSLLNYARSFPMMGGQQLIIVKDAQAIKGFGANDAKDEKDNLKFLEQYFLAPQASTILLLCFADTIDERKTWVKAAAKNGILFKSKKMYDDKLPAWVVDYCHLNNRKISPKAVQILVDHVGNDLNQMAAELDKLSLNLKDNEEINAQTIEKYVGISKEYNVFELQKAIGRRDLLKTNQILLYFAKNQKDNPLPLLIISLYSYFVKLLMMHASRGKTDSELAALIGVNPYFVKDYLQAARHYNYAKVIQIIHQLKLADLQAKGIDSGSKTERDILLDLGFVILH